MYEDSAHKPQQIYLNLNASKVRWLAETKITATNTFALGSGENLVIDFFNIQIHLWENRVNCSFLLKPI
jgi:hypothetical protein